jgi:mannose-6-phosphate isomerase-like protein (cupin superfamily)
VNGREIINARSWERIVFRELEFEPDGDLLEMDDFWGDVAHEVPMHHHPTAEERWEVVEGVVLFRIGDEEITAGPGDRVIAPAGVPHSAQNIGGTEVHLRVEMQPALRWVEFVEKWFALPSDDGQHVVELLAAYTDEIVI